MIGNWLASRDHWFWRPDVRHLKFRKGDEKIENLRPFFEMLSGCLKWNRGAVDARSGGVGAPNGGYVDQSPVVEDSLHFNGEQDHDRHVIEEGSGSALQWCGSATLFLAPSPVLSVTSTKPDNCAGYQGELLHTGVDDTAAGQPAHQYSRQRRHQGRDSHVSSR